MSKIKVLVVPSDRTGVGKFRSVDPHIFLQNLYGEDFHVDIIYEPNYDDMLGKLTTLINSLNCVGLGGTRKRKKKFQNRKFSKKLDDL